MLSIVSINRQKSILTTLLVITVINVIDFIDGCRTYMSLISGIYFVFKKRSKMIAVSLFTSSKVGSLGVLCLVLILLGAARVVAKEVKNRRR